MKIAEIMPLAKGFKGKDYLTYFTAKDIKPGHIVLIPLRKKIVPGLVLGVRKAEEDKSELKSADFETRKIAEIKGDAFFTNAFTSMCEKVAEYALSSTGEIIETLIPSVLLANADKLDTSQIPDKITSSSKSLLTEKLIYQAGLDDRISYYKTYIRESFARKASVFIAIPTRHDMHFFEEELKKGIEEYVYVFHGDVKDKEQLAMTNKLFAETHPVLIIGTPRFTSLVRKDVNTIIVERESSSAYKDIRRPYLDFRIVLETLAAEMSAKLIFGDTLLRTDTIARHDDGELGEIASPSFRIPQSSKEICVDMRNDRPVGKKKTWNPLSEELITALKDVLLRDGSAALFTLRKGLAPVTVCHDCGETVQCPECASPLILYKGSDAESRIYLCNKCGSDFDTKIKCKKCDSWNLVPLGIGTETVEEAIKELFPEADIFILDKDHAKTYKQAQDIVAKFEASKKSIIIGTELMFFHLKKQVRLTALISFDSLFSIPSFRINEKILFILYSLKQASNHTSIIQTRFPENDVLKSFLSGNVVEVYRDEMKIRKTLLYPPYSTIIKMSAKGTYGAVSKLHDSLAVVFRDFSSPVYTSFIKRVGTAYVVSALIKIPRLEWTLKEISREGRTNPTLRGLLRSLPPYMAISVDPDDIL